MLRHWREDPFRESGGLMATRVTRGKPPSYIRLSECPVGWVWDARIHTMISPNIEVVPYWYGTTVSIIPVPVEIRNPLQPRQPYAQVLWEGHNLRFSSEYTEGMPDDVLRRLIAHELAHVYQAAVGDEVWFDFDFAPGLGDRELHADQMADSWGFNGDAFDQWTVDAGISKVNLVKTLKEFLRLPHRYDN